MQPARHKYLYIRAIMRFQLDNWLPMTSFTMAEAALMSASGESSRYRDAVAAPTMASCRGGRADSIAALHCLAREALEEVLSLFIAGECLVLCSGRAALQRARGGPSRQSVVHLLDSNPLRPRRSLQSFITNFLLLRPTLPLLSLTLILPYAPYPHPPHLITRPSHPHTALPLP